MVTLKIDGITCQVEEGTTVLEAARSVGINIPTLCWLKGINEIGACRICVVEMKGGRSLAASCVYPISKFDEGKEFFTHSKAVLESRKTTLQLLLSNHDQNCLACARSGKCELQTLCRELGVTDSNVFEGTKNKYDIDESALHMYRDNNKCINCKRCVATCGHNVYAGLNNETDIGVRGQTVGVIGANNRGFNMSVGCAFDMPLAESACISCGQCITACPTGALSEKDDTDKVWDAINDPEKVVVVQTAPAVRASLGEIFGYPMGTSVEAKMARSLRMLGFDFVFDTNFGADLTIIEEANELLDRVTKGGVLPMITSCSPGWIRFSEAFFPEFLPNISSCKSPQQMTGAMIKSYWAKKKGIDPKNIVSVSVMPCTAKKFEIQRPNQSGMKAAGLSDEYIPDLDISITTRELAKMIEKAGIRFTELPTELDENSFDSPYGNGSGAAVIFGSTGGVMEAALRTAVWRLSGGENSVAEIPVEYEEVRGVKGIKLASYKAGDVEIKVAVASGLANARDLLNKVKTKEIDVHFIEIMACPGGCVNGGGQAIVPSSVRNFVDVREERAKALYNLDKSNSHTRFSHETTDVKNIYKDFLGEPGSHLAHELLHTSYKPSKTIK